MKAGLDANWTVEESFSCSYKGDEHTEFVRGLSWKPGSKQLLSSGWDGRVLEHSVAASPMETGRGEI